MKTFISKIQFAELLANIIGSTFAQIVSETEPKLNKKSRATGEPLPFAKVINARDLNIQLGYNYEKQVNDKAEKENLKRDFQAQPHPWAKRVKGQLACHNSVDLVDLNTNEPKNVADLDVTKLYVPYKVQSISSQQYFGDNKPINKSVLADFFPNKDFYPNQPAEEKTQIQYMKLASVKAFRLNGIEYEIVE